MDLLCCVLSIHPVGSKWRFGSWKYSCHQLTQKGGGDQKHLTSFSISHLPCAYAQAPYCLVTTRSRQELDYSSCEKFHRCSNLLCYKIDYSKKKQSFFLWKKKSESNWWETKMKLLIWMVVLKILNVWILQGWKSFTSLFAMVNERASAKKKRADATSKDSICIPTFSQNRSAFPFKENFPKKNLLQSKWLMSNSLFFPLMFWFA